jgi:hypothetical protein
MVQEVVRLTSLQVDVCKKNSNGQGFRSNQRYFFTVILGCSTRRDYSRRCRSPRWGRRNFVLAMSRALRSARTRRSNLYSR